MIYTISGTEIGAILGLNPYMDPMKLYLLKKGLIERDPENEAMKWGTAAEHVVARRYAKETGYELFPGVDEGYDYTRPLVHPEYDWWVGTPDRGIITKPIVFQGNLEIKIVGERMAHQWGEPPDGDIPEQYLTQCAWYMPLLGVEWADLAVQIGNRDYRVYRINRDREFEDQLRDAALAFINDHLIPGIPPPIDGSESSRIYLNYKYPKERGPVLEPTDEDIIKLVAAYAANRQVVKELEGKVSELENHLKSIIGDAAGMQGEWGKIYWKKNKDSVKTDWETAFKSLAIYLDNNNLMSKELTDGHLSVFSKPKPGARVFRPYFKED